MPKSLGCGGEAVGEDEDEGEEEEYGGAVEERFVMWEERWWRE